MSNFDEIISRASALMNNAEFNRLVEQKAGNKNRMNSKQSGDAQIAMFEAQAFGTPQISTPSAYQPMTPNNNATAVSKLPEVIRESFDRVPPITSYQPSMGGLMGTPTPQQNNGSIDYSIIKALIDESISRHLNEIKQQLLTENENTLKGIRLGNGNKIVLVDKNNNIYDASLKKRDK